MLPVTTLSATYPLVADLDRRGLALEPREGTMLSNLTRISHPRAGCFIDNYAAPYKLHFGWIANCVNTPDSVLGVSEQDVRMKELVSQISKALQGHLLHTRTVVVPAIDDIVNRVIPQLDEISRLSINALKITIKKLPAPLMEPALLDAINKARDTVVDNQGPTLYCAEASMEQITEYAKSGTPSLDASVAGMMAELGEETVAHIWRKLFCSGTAGTTLKETIYDPSYSLEAAIIGFMVARKLWNNPPEGVNMSGASYEQSMVALRDQCAVRLVNGLARWDRDCSAGLLVASYGLNEVVVNDKVYKKWLSEGGTNEVLFGCILSRNPEVTVAAINQRTPEFLQTWQYVCTANKSREMNERFAVAKDMVRREFNASVAQASQDELPLQDRQIAVKLFEEELAKSSMDEVMDPYNWIMRLITKSRFYKTDAYAILCGIAKVKKHSPTVETREAAAVALIEYVADWVSTQFVIQKATR
jgi:hypothetical protein